MFIKLQKIHKSLTFSVKYLTAVKSHVKDLFIYYQNTLIPYWCRVTSIYDKYINYTVYTNFNLDFKHYKI